MSRVHGHSGLHWGRTIIVFKYNSEEVHGEGRPPRESSPASAPAETKFKDYVILESNVAFQQAFSEENLEKLKTISESIDVSSCLEAISLFGVSHPVQPFHLLGIQPIGVKTPYTIYELEKVITSGSTDALKYLFKENFRIKGVKSAESKLKMIILSLNKFPSRHLVASMGNTINLVRQGLCIPKHKYTTLYKANYDFDQLKAECKQDYLLLPFCNMIERLGNMDRDEFMDTVTNYKESDLQDLVSDMLSVSFFVKNGEQLVLPLKGGPNSGVCFPDLLCFPNYMHVVKKEQISEVSLTVTCTDDDSNNDDLSLDSELKSSPLTAAFSDKELSSGVTSFDDEMNINKEDMASTLLWQLFEQLLGQMIRVNKKMQYTGNILFQSTVLICNGEANICVLTMDVDTFFKIHKLVMFTDTLDVLMSLARSGKQFCKLYFCTKRYHVGDTFGLVRGCAKYFSQSHNVTSTDQL